jgi:N utilization substance protein A
MATRQPQKNTELLRLVDQMHFEKGIPREIIWEGIEAALQLAAQKHYGEGADIVVKVDHDTGLIHAWRGQEAISPLAFDLSSFSRIIAQSAKQVMIQRIREAEANAIYNEYAAQRGELVQGVIQRREGEACIVRLGKTEAILPRSEQIPGETHRVEERIKAIVLEVKRVGQRVRIILSRTHPEFVRRLFEREIPEIQERIIEIRGIAREAGHRTKVGVSSIDLKVDCVGACVGVRGARIKNIVDELGGERIDIVRWNDSPHVLIPNALQPAQVDDVLLYQRLGRAIVLVKEDQLSVAIGRKGQNVRLASKLVGWDIEIMTPEELDATVEKANAWFRQLPGATEELVEAFISEGYLSYTDLTFLEPAEMAQMVGISEEQAEEIISYAEAAAERLEQEAKSARIAEETTETAEATGAATSSSRTKVSVSSREDEARRAFDRLFRSEEESEAAAAAEEGENLPHAEGEESLAAAAEEDHEAEAPAEEEAAGPAAPVAGSSEEPPSEEPSAATPAPKEKLSGGN